MNYELAKKLKDAGFSQKRLNITGVYVGICRHGFYGFSEGRESCECEEPDTVHFPDLSELIKACGNHFQSLNHMLKDIIVGISGTGVSFWRATGGITAVENFNGETPEEAVANLWLKLNSFPTL